MQYIIPTLFTVEIKDRGPRQGPHFSRILDFYLLLLSVYPEFQPPVPPAVQQERDKYSGPLWSPLEWCASLVQTDPLQDTQVCWTMRWRDNRDKGVVVVYSPISLATVWSLLRHLLTKTMSRPLRASWRQTDAWTDRQLSYYNRSTVNRSGLVSIRNRCIMTVIWSVTSVA